jgi:hypothetical protein
VLANRKRWRLLVGESYYVIQMLRFCNPVPRSTLRPVGDIWVNYKDPSIAYDTEISTRELDNNNSNNSDTHI